VSAFELLTVSIVKVLVAGLKEMKEGKAVKKFREAE